MEKGEEGKEGEELEEEEELEEGGDMNTLYFKFVFNQIKHIAPKHIIS